MPEPDSDLLAQLIAGEIALCQWPGCRNTFRPPGGKSCQKYCGEPDCHRHHRPPTVQRAHRARAITDIRVELREIDKSAHVPELVVQRTRELGRALKSGTVSDDDLRVAACQLAAAAALVAATVEACGRAGLTSQSTPADAAASNGSTGDERPLRTLSQTAAARAALVVAS